MFTVLSNTRKSDLFLVGAIVLLAALLTVSLVPSLIVQRPPLIPVTGVQNANDLFRQEERALYVATVDSLLGSSTFYEYRRGEHIALFSPDLHDFSNFQFREGEWLGQ